MLELLREVLRVLMLGYSYAWCSGFEQPGLIDDKLMDFAQVVLNMIGHG